METTSRARAAEADEHRDGHVLAELSNQMVRIYKDQFGRGPTRASCKFAGPDAVLCTLENSLTPAEQNLAEMGEHQRLRDVRLFFQHATEPQFVTAVEKITGRKVRAFISGIDTTADVSAEIFYLDKPDVDGSSELLPPGRVRLEP
jgi:uncharacterized protein YbcI